jgi:putative endonuclease
MKWVYLLRSSSDPAQRYVGQTSDLQRRLDEHNAGKSTHTKKHLPWECVTAVWFSDDEKANAFEKYLKQGSGHAFANHHFW